MRWFNRRGAERGNGMRGGVALVCPNCGTVNPPGSRFCNNCGHRLTITGALATPPILTDEGGSEERRVVTILFADLANSTALADETDAEELRTLLSRYFALMAEWIHTHGGIVEKFIGDAVMGIFGLPQVHEDDPVRAVRAGIDMQIALARFNAERREFDPNAPELVMRIGINTGEVVAATGPADGRDFLVTGDPVNVAARLQGAAEPGTVLVGPRTYRDTQGAVDYIALPPTELKGKPHPIHVWRAMRMLDVNPVPLARARSLEGPRAPLIGRDAEMRLLESVYLRTLQARRPRVVTLLGAPGVGKTRLAREFIRGATEDTLAAQALIGRCALYGEETAYWPLAEMLRDYCGITPATPPNEARTQITAYVAQALLDAGRIEDPTQVARLLAYTIGLETLEQPTGVAAERRRVNVELADAWRVFFESLATRAPLIVMIDDAHWAADELLDVIKTIARRASGYPILFLCTARPELVGRPSQEEWGASRGSFVAIALEPLLPDESGMLVAALLAGDTLPADLRNNILQRAEGNPFFIEEIVRMLIDRQVIRQEDGRWRVAPDWADTREATDVAIPDTVQGVLAARIDLLSPEERDILRHASVIGRTFWPSALMGIADHLTWPQLEGGLRGLIAKDLIAPATATLADDEAVSADEPRYIFRHPMTRDVVYDAMPRARRAHEHRHFAEWLERFAAGHEAAYADLLARHYALYYQQANLARARDPERRRAVRAKVTLYLEMAGDEAMIRHAPRAAERSYTRAIALLLEDGATGRIAHRDDLISLYAHRGDARALQSDGDGAYADFGAALALWRDYPDATECSPAEERQTGMRLYRRLVTLPARYASWFRSPPSHEELREYLTAGLDLARVNGDDRSLDLAALLAAQSFFWWSWPQGRGKEQLRAALASAEEAVAITEAAGDPRAASEALDALGNMQATVTNLRGFLASQSRRLYWAEGIEDRNEVIDIHNEVSAAHQMVGEYGRAVEHGRIGLTLAEEIENEVLRAQALQRLVISYYEWDHWSNAINDGDLFMAVAARTPMTTQNHYRWGVLAYAVALLRTGQADRADRVLRTYNDLPRINESQYVPVFRARAQLAMGHVAEAEPILRGALDIGAGRHIFPALLAELAELGARLGRRDLTDEFGQQAVNVADGAGAQKPLAQALRARGLVALADGRFTDAARDLDDSLMRFTDLGTPWEEARTRYVLAELLRRQGNTSAAEASLRAALSLFEQVGAVRDIARAKNALAGGDIRLP